MKKLITGFCLLVLTAGLIGCTTAKVDNENSKDSKSSEEKVTIGITQIVEHPALDSAREGFIKALSEKGFVEGENLVLDYKNAQGDINTAQTIANGFVSDKVDMIFAVATPTAQAAYNSTKDIPILITAVTDPVSSGLAKSMDKSETNVTGTSDMAPIDPQFRLIQQLVPSAKKIGVIYNTGEANSEIQVKFAEEKAKELGLELVKKGVTTTNEVAQALEALVSQIDVLYTPTDNMIASSMSLIAAKTAEKNIPIIGAESAHVEQGALATEGIDYFELGYQTGMMAVEVLQGKAPTDLPLATLKNTELIINTKVADTLGIEVPAELKESATIQE